MKREDLIKGQIIQHPVLGNCKVLSIAKAYARLQQLEFSNIVCKFYFN